MVGEPVTLLYGRRQAWHDDGVAKTPKKAVEPQTGIDTKTVTITQKSWTHCDLCAQRVFYLTAKGAAAAALTEHYNQQHLSELVLA